MSATGKICVIEKLNTPTGTSTPSTPSFVTPIIPALSPTAAVRRTYEALAAYADPALFISIKPEAEALAEAAALETAGPAGKPLYGKLFAVKDNIDAAGLPTTAACPSTTCSSVASRFQE